MSESWQRFSRRYRPSNSMCIRRRWPRSVNRPHALRRRTGSNSSGCGMRPRSVNANFAVSIPTIAWSRRNWSGAGKQPSASSRQPKQPMPNACRPRTWRRVHSRQRYVRPSWILADTAGSVADGGAVTITTQSAPALSDRQSHRPSGAPGRDPDPYCVERRGDEHLRGPRQRRRLHGPAGGRRNGTADSDPLCRGAYGRRDCRPAHAAGVSFPQRPQVLPSTVKTMRLKHGLMQQRHQSHPRWIAGYLTVPQLAQRLGGLPIGSMTGSRMGRFSSTKIRPRACTCFQMSRRLEQLQQLQAGMCTQVSMRAPTADIHPQEQGGVC